MPFDLVAVEAALVPEGQDVLIGDIQVVAGTRVAMIGGLTAGVFSLQPPHTLFGNLREVAAPGASWDMFTFAGLGLSYLPGAAGGNFPRPKGASGQAFSTAATTHTYIYPPGLVANDVLLIVIATGGLTTITPPGTWTHVGSQSTSASTIAAYKRIIDGTETDTEIVTFGTAAGAIIHDWTLDKASGDMEITSAVDDSPAATTLDIGAVTPSWSVAEATNNYYIAIIGMDVNAGTTISAFPAGYTLTGQDGIASGTASIDCRLGFAEKAALSQTENPGAFTYGASRSAGMVIAIRPANAGRLNWDGLAVRKNSTGATISTQRRLNLIEGTGITINVVDDPTDGEVDVTITNSGAGGTAGWDDTLLVDAHTGATNPIIDDAQFIQWGIATPDGPGQARTAEPFLFTADVSWHLDAGEEIQLVAFDGSLFRVTAGSLTLRAFDSLNLTSDDSSIVATALNNITMTSGGDMTFTPSGFLHMGSPSLTNDIALQSAGIIDINSSADIVSISGNTGMNIITSTGTISMQSPVVALITGFLRFTEAAASTPSMAAGQGLFWVKNDVPNNPFFTDDTNVDRQIATFPIPLTGLASQAADTFVGRLAGAGVPTAQNLADIDSTSIIYDITSHTFQLGAHTGDVTSTQNSLALTIAADAVTNAKMADMAAKSVKANATNAAANPTDVAATVALQHLRNNAANTALEWSVLTTADFPNNSVPITALAQTAALTVIANATNATATPTAVQSVANDTVFRTTGSTLNWGQLTVGMAPNDVWTYAKIQNVSATSRFLGRITAAAGDIEELTGTQATSLLDVFGAAKGLVPASAGGTVNFLRADGTFAVPPGGNPGHVIRVDGVDQTQRAAANFVDTTDILFTPTDDAVNGETELRATFATVAANTFAANATAGVAAYTPIALAAESIIARTSGNIGQITSAVQSILMRGAGSLFFGTAAADQVLRRSGSGDLGFGTLVTNNFGDDQVTNAKLATMTAKSVKANATNAAANPTDLGATVALQHLRNNSANTALEWSVLQAADFPADTVPIASLATIAANTVLANATASTDNATAFAVGTNTLLGRVGGNIVAAQLADAQIASNTIGIAKLQLANSAAWTGAHTWSSTADFNGAVDCNSTTRMNARFSVGAFVNVGTTTQIDNLSIGANNSVRFTGAASRVLTGMIPVVPEGQVIFIINAATGGNTLIISGEDTDSDAANRFLVGTTTILLANQMVIAHYDFVSSRWRVCEMGTT